MRKSSYGGQRGRGRRYQEEQSDFRRSSDRRSSSGFGRRQDESSYDTRGRFDERSNVSRQGYQGFGSRQRNENLASGRFKDDNPSYHRRHSDAGIGLRSEFGGSPSRLSRLEKEDANDGWQVVRPGRRQSIGGFGFGDHSGRGRNVSTTYNTSKNDKKVPEKASKEEVVDWFSAIPSHNLNLEEDWDKEVSEMANGKEESSGMNKAETENKTESLKPVEAVKNKDTKRKEIKNGNGTDYEKRNGTDITHQTEEPCNETDASDRKDRSQENEKNIEENLSRKMASNENSGGFKDNSNTIENQGHTILTEKIDLPDKTPDKIDNHQSDIRTYNGQCTLDSKDLDILQDEKQNHSLTIIKDNDESYMTNTNTEIVHNVKDAGDTTNDSHFANEDTISAVLQCHSPLTCTDTSSDMAKNGIHRSNDSKSSGVHGLNGNYPTDKSHDENARDLNKSSVVVRSDLDATFPGRNGTDNIIDANGICNNGVVVKNKTEQVKIFPGVKCEGNEIEDSTKGNIYTDSNASHDVPADENGDDSIVKIMTDGEFSYNQIKQTDDGDPSDFGKRPNGISTKGRKRALCLPTGQEESARQTCECLGDIGYSFYLRTTSIVDIRHNDEDRDGEDDSLGDPDMIIKHPLQNSWAMWFLKNDKSRDWKDNLRVITTFDTVEDFWGLYNHTLPASKLQTGCDYSVFKAGIQPMWEDPQNKKGGRWLINLNKTQRQTHLDDFWLETLLCLIGEGFDEHSEDICGATVNIRTKGDKLGLWTRDASKTEATKKIGTKLKESLNVPSKIVIGFQAHSDTAGKAGSTVKNRFTV